jgi:hypothetical protein
MNTIDKLNNTLGYLTAMSFDRPELSNDLIEPLNTLSEAISEVENLSLSGVSQQRELLKAFKKNHIHNFGNTPITINELEEYIDSL